MANLLAVLVLVSASIGIIIMSGSLAWCWMNRKRLLYRKF